MPLAISAPASVPCEDYIQHAEPEDIVNSIIPSPPPNDIERRRTVEVLGLEAAAPFHEAGRLLQLMCTMLGAEEGAVTLMAPGKRAHVTCAHKGMQGDIPACRSVCAWALLAPQPTVLVVDNFAEDGRYAHIAWEDLGWRSYIGCPLLASNGHRFGSICFAQYQPRRFTSQEVRVLTSFSELVAREIERQARLPQLLRSSGEVQAAFQRMQRPPGAADRCVLLVDAGGQEEEAGSGCRVTWASPVWREVTDQGLGLGQGLAGGEDVTGMELGSVFAAGGGQAGALGSALECMTAQGCAFVLPGMQLRLKPQPQSQPQGAGAASSGGSSGDATAAAVRYDLTFRPVTSALLDEDALLINMPSYVPDPPAVPPAAATAAAAASSRRLARYYFVGVAEVAAASRSSCAAARPLSMPRQELAASILPGLHMQQVLGAGAQAVVYRAAWKGRPVAVKVMNPLEEGSSGLQQALFEVQVAQRCVHPNIVATLTYAQAWHSGAQAHGLASSSSHLLVPASASQQQHQQQQEEGSVDGYFQLTYERGSSSSSSSRASTASWAGTLSGSGTSSSSSSSGQQQLAPAASTSSSSTVPFPPSASTTAASCAEGSSSAGTGGSGDPAACAFPLLHWPLLRGSPCDWPSSAAGRSSSYSSSSGTGRPAVSLIAVLELCDRGCLQDAVDMAWLMTARSRAVGQPRLAAVLATACEVASGLAALHAAGVVHGDLSAYNVMLSSTGAGAAAGGRGFVAKVADFGMSHSLGLSSLLRVNSYGTVTHMAPEVLLHSVSSKAADVYSFGVLLWQMLTASRPWAGLRHDAVVDAVARQRLALRWPASVPGELAELGAECMAWEATRRPDMQAVLARLTELAEGECGLVQQQVQGLVEDF